MRQLPFPCPRLFTLYHRYNHINISIYYDIVRILLSLKTFSSRSIRPISFQRVDVIRDLTLYIDSDAAATTRYHDTATLHPGYLHLEALVSAAGATIVSC